MEQTWSSMMKSWGTLHSLAMKNPVIIFPLFFDTFYFDYKVRPWDIYMHQLFKRGVLYIIPKWYLLQEIMELTNKGEMVGWHHQLNGHEFEQVLGVDDRQGSLACCSPWGHRVGHDWATELTWNKGYKTPLHANAFHFVMNLIPLIWVFCIAGRFFTIWTTREAF